MTPTDASLLTAEHLRTLADRGEVSGVFTVWRDAILPAHAGGKAHGLRGPEHRGCGVMADGLLDPDMPAQSLRQHIGEMTPDEMRTARAAIRWANAVARDAMKTERCHDR